MKDNYSCCGYNCDNCPLFKATKTNDVSLLMKIYKLDENTECSVKSHGCLGCRSEVRTHMCKSCFIRNCCNEKGIDDCSSCSCFPCGYLKENISKETMEYLVQKKKKLR